ncbi:MFS transporter [Corynebacterium aquatimens]|uniref:MFS transporter n=1 Tax=Corynebacterium aquatimens TaxID=1190508 RepID=UPI00253FB417|nr:MFS transporter [Corynebacterium aquatimens]QYH19954.1 MFS transporter [Corynebacterium aquatimens]
MSTATGAGPKGTDTAGKMPGAHKRTALGAAISEIGFAVTLTGLSFFTPMVLKDFPEFTTSSFLIYYTIYGFASAFTMLAAAQLIDKLKAQGLMIIGGAIATAGLALFAFSQSLWMFYLAGLIIGVGVGLSVQYVPVVVINRWFIEKRGTVLGAVLAGSGVGGVILGFLVPPLMGSIGWRSTMLVLAGIMAAATILPGLFMIRNNPEDQGLSPYGAPPADKMRTTAKDEWEPGLPQEQALKSPWFWVLLASLAIFGITYGMTQHLVNYLNSAPWGMAVSPQLISTIVVLATVLLIPYKPALGWVVDKIGLEKALVLCFTIASIGFVIFAFARSPWVFIASMFLVAVGLATGTVTPPLIGERAFGQRDFSKLWGILGMAYPIGLSVGASLWGLIPDLTGTYFWGFVGVPVVTAIYVIGFLVVIRRSRNLWVPEAEAHLENMVGRGEVSPAEAKAIAEDAEE